MLMVACRNARHWNINEDLALQGGEEVNSRQVSYRDVQNYFPHEAPMML